MDRRTYFLAFFFSVLNLICLVSAASPTSFCKCTCFSNSTIIALDSRVSTSSAHSFLERAAKKTCNDCNRQFCLSYNFDFCKGAKEEDVFTTCFQRDSTKDQAVVLIFICATGGLLIYAVFQPWVEQWWKTARERRSYSPLSGPADR